MGIPNSFVVMAVETVESFCNQVDCLQCQSSQFHLLEWPCSGEQVGKKKLTPWGLWVVASLWPELTYSAS